MMDRVAEKTDEDMRQLIDANETDLTNVYKKREEYLNSFKAELEVLKHENRELRERVLEQEKREFEVVQDNELRKIDNDSLSRKLDEAKSDVNKLESDIKALRDQLLQKDELLLKRAEKFRKELASVGNITVQLKSYICRLVPSAPCSEDDLTKKNATNSKKMIDFFKVLEGEIKKIGSPPNDRLVSIFTKLSSDNKLYRNYNEPTATDMSNIFSDNVLKLLVDIVREEIAPVYERKETDKVIRTDDLLRSYASIIGKLRETKRTLYDLFKGKSDQLKSRMDRVLYVCSMSPELCSEELFDKSDEELNKIIEKDAELTGIIPFDGNLEFDERFFDNVDYNRIAFVEEPEAQTTDADEPVLTQVTPLNPAPSTRTIGKRPFENADENSASSRKYALVEEQIPNTSIVLESDTMLNPTLHESPMHDPVLNLSNVKHNFEQSAKQSMCLGFDLSKIPNKPVNPLLFIESNKVESYTRNVHLMYYLISIFMIWYSNKSDPTRFSEKSYEESSGITQTLSVLNNNRKLRINRQLSKIKKEESETVVTMTEEIVKQSRLDNSKKIKKIQYRDGVDPSQLRFFPLEENAAAEARRVYSEIIIGIQKEMLNDSAYDETLKRMIKLTEFE
ncbi:hypothetical protein QAD02_001455 [Eretmocerus hayati]|uniref:Uncharacterized protein n=1 Tax=Eretmocerus hayati TaxID=131215 RepID=A0ACC2NHU3_9HYME|nr:hypothetical protein QAD02_001455 [Eretmocerus hayati]